MNLKFILLSIDCILVIILYVSPCVSPLGISAGIVAGIAAIGGGYFGLNQIANFETCNGETSNTWINYNPNFNNLGNHLFGQHIALKIVPNAIKRHLNDRNPPKALVLSFHGHVGVGKNHLASLIANEIYTKYKTEGDSKFVHYLLGTSYIERNTKSGTSKFRKIIENGVANCGRSLFIIDELDKFPEMFLDDLASYLSSNTPINGIKFNKAIFMLLSNSASLAINSKTFELRSNGVNREDIKYMEFEKILQTMAMQGEEGRGGLKNSELIKHGLIDRFVPFLPLEKEHVKLCIKHYLQSHLNYTNPEQDPGIKFIEDVAQALKYDSKLNLYTEFGCRPVKSKILKFNHIIGINLLKC